MLQGPGDQPVSERLPLAPATGPPAGLFHDRGHVPAPGPPVDIPGVAGETSRGGANLFGDELDDLGGYTGEICGDEAQEPEPADLYGEADPLHGPPVGTQPAQVVERQGEVGGQVAAGDLGRP